MNDSDARSFIDLAAGTAELGSINKQHEGIFCTKMPPGFHGGRPGIPPHKKNYDLILASTTTIRYATQSTA